MNRDMSQMPTGGLGSFLTSNMDEIDDNILAFGKGQGINSMSKIANRMANMGRNGDNQLVHVKTGELIVSPEILENNPKLAKELTQSFQNMDENIGDYVVGSDGNSINPMTGQREFFLKGLVKGIKNLFTTLAPTLLVNFLLPGAGPVLKGLVGGGIGGLLQGKGVKGALEGAAMGGLAGGLFSGFKGMGKGGPGFVEGFKQGFTSPTDLVSSISEKGGTFMDKVFPKGFIPKGMDPSSEQFKAIEQSFITDRGFSPREAYQAALERTKPGFTDYIGPAVAGTAVVGALGGFDTPDQTMPDPYGGVTSTKLVQENPELYRVLFGGLRPPRRTRMEDTVVPTPDPFLFEKYLDPQLAAKGGEMFPRKTGSINGPGTETSDDVPAMLSDGEFVMTARAVRGLGDGSRKQGIKKMYDMMKNFERSVPA